MYYPNTGGQNVQGAYVREYKSDLIFEKITDLDDVLRYHAKVEHGFQAAFGRSGHEVIVLLQESRLYRTLEEAKAVAEKACMAYLAAQLLAQEAQSESFIDDTPYR